MMLRGRRAVRVEDGAAEAGVVGLDPADAGQQDQSMPQDGDALAMRAAATR